MNPKIEDEGIIELGVASIETQGKTGIVNEELGFRPMGGISDE